MLLISHVLIQMQVFDLLRQSSKTSKEKFIIFSRVGGINKNTMSSCSERP